MPTTAPYGSWKSPITSELIVSEAIGLGGIALDRADIYWVEMRPSEGGRRVIVRRTPDGQTADVTPRPFNVRTRVHEYGGGDFVVADGVVYFANFDDQRLYFQETGFQETGRQQLGGVPQPITPAANPAAGLRYADMVVDKSRNRLIAVGEDHTGPEGEPVNSLVAIPRSGGVAQVLVSGSDFYASPRLSPDGSVLAWLSWNHPNMPWDGAELWTAAVAADGSLDLTEPAELVAGGLTESIFQPEWSPDSVLYFVSDRTGWWNLYRWRQGTVEPVTPPLELEFGKPQWVFGSATYGFAAAERIICAGNDRGAWQLYSLDTATGGLEPIPLPYTEMGRTDFKVAPGQVVFGAGSPTEPVSILRLDLSNGSDFTLEILQKAGSVAVDAGYLSAPRTIEFPTEDGLTAYAFYYPPQNRDFAATDGEKPPLLVKSHGGANRSRQHCPGPDHPVLDQPGYCGAGRELRRQYRLRTGLPGPAQGTLGPGGRERLR